MNVLIHINILKAVWRHKIFLFSAIDYVLNGEVLLYLLFSNNNGNVMEMNGQMLREKYL